MIDEHNLDEYDPDFDEITDNFPIIVCSSVRMVTSLQLMTMMWKLPLMMTMSNMKMMEQSCY